MNVKIKWALWGVWSLTSLCSSCNKGEESPHQAPHVLRMNINREPLTLDPRRGSELIGSTLHFILFEGLMRLHPDGSIHPAQAETVEISDDRKTYTFHLRDTVWSDGSPITALDFAVAWKRILAPDFPSANVHLFYPIKNAELAKKGDVSLEEVGIYVIDDKTLLVELEHPTPYFLELVSFCVFYPVSHQIDEQNPSWFCEAGPQFVSNGPFKLSSWKHNNEILFEKNPLYWESNQIFLDQIFVSMIGDEITALKMYENNELDIIGHSISRIPNEALLTLYKRKLLHFTDLPGTVVVCFNNSQFPFNNKNIRKAFSYAIHRKELVENITQLGEEIATNILSPALINHKNRSYFKDHDTQLALACFQKGLEELGVHAEEFPEIFYNYSLSDINHLMAQALQNQWAEVLGVKVTLRMNEHKVLLDNLKMKNYYIAQSFWIAQYNDPFSILERFKSKKNVKNPPGWEHPEYSRLLEKSALAPTAEDRLKNFEAAEELLMEEMPLAPLYHLKSAFMIKPHLSLLNYSPKGAFDYARLSWEPTPHSKGNPKELP